MENNVPKVYLLGKTYLTNNETFYIRNDPIIHMAAGDRHTIIVTESGRAYAFGDNSSGQLGLGHTNAIEKVSCIKSLKFSETGEKVILTACGRDSSIVATNQGSLYAFGSNYHCQLGFESKDLSTIHPHPIKIESFHSKMSWKQLSMGAEHTCALTNDGKVYVWGSNEDGQCGFARKFDIIKIPKELRLQYSVISISCGYYHTALISQDNRLFLFGNNSDGQLGCSISNEYIGPSEVSLSDPIKIVACGNQHTVVLTEKGDVYICGRGDRGQLGLGRKVLITKHFVMIENLPKHLTDIAAGEAHTIIVDSDSNLYVFGDGKYGKLSFETHSYEYQPLFIDKFKGYNIFKIICGGCQTIILAEKKSNEEDIANNIISLKSSPIKNFLHTNSIDDKLNTIHIKTNGILEQQRNLFKFNQTISYDTQIDDRNNTNNLQIKTNFDDEIFSSNERLLPICELIERKNSLNITDDQYNLPTPSSTTSGCTSSSISSIQDENSTMLFDLNNQIQDKSHSSTTKLYQINSNHDSTTFSIPTESKSGFFSKIFGIKSLPKSSKTINRNSRTCLIM